MKFQNMEVNDIIKELKKYGVGRRKLDDPLFADDEPLPKFALYCSDEEDSKNEVLTIPCEIPGCKFSADSLLDYENHYNASHRYACSQCKKMVPSPHLLDLHIQENHDSYFAVLAVKKPSYSCYIEECKDKFMNAKERRDHCVKIHKLPKDFRFDQKPRKNKKSKSKSNNSEMNDSNNMEIDKIVQQTSAQQNLFHNGKKKTFQKYTGKKIVKNKETGTTDVNIDAVMCDLRESLPV